METHLVRYVAQMVDYFTVLMLTLILISCILEKHKQPLLKIYIGMASTCAAALLCEALSYSASFVDFQAVNIMRVSLCTVAVMCGYVLAFFYACYVANLVGFHHKICKMMIKILRHAAVIFAVILALGVHLGYFFTVENGMFITSQFFIGIFAYDILACLTGIFLIIKFRKNLKLKDIIALMTLPAFVFLSGLMQYTSFGLMFGLFLVCAVALLIIYLMIQTERNRQKLEQEQQIVDMNIALMISQIQPHFLYNSLSSIKRMIKKDPNIAETAIENFSMYLRQNLESMNHTELIPFSSELRHVEEYLYLEKLRFGERLYVEYDIAYSDFALPVLTLQPIVENAVKHGVLQKEDGGIVKIAACKNGDNVILTVSDNGVGFNPDEADIKDRQHIGFENVKKRIEMQCKGTINIESQVGKGTTVTMTIPLM